MKSTKKNFLGIGALALVCGLVLAACNTGEYKATGYGDTATIKLELGKKYTVTVAGIEVDQGTWKKSGKTITFKSDYGENFKGTLDGKKLKVNGIIFTKKSAINEWDEIELEFADDLSLDEIDEFFN